MTSHDSLLLRVYCKATDVSVTDLKRQGETAVNEVLAVMLAIESGKHDCARALMEAQDWTWQTVISDRDFIAACRILSERIHKAKARKMRKSK